MPVTDAVFAVLQGEAKMHSDIAIILFILKYKKRMNDTANERLTSALAT